jgi:hypothetical protein
MVQARSKIEVNFSACAISSNGSVAEVSVREAFSEVDGWIRVSIASSVFAPSA